MSTPGSNGPPAGFGLDADFPFDATVTFDGLYAPPRKTLLDFRNEMMVRLGFAAQLASPPPGMVLELNSFLQDAQEQLYLDYAPLRTERWWSADLVEGQRFYQMSWVDTPGLTNTLDYLRITWAGLADGATWHPIKQGINPLEFTVDSPGLPTAFDVREYLEVWPTPDKPMTLWLRGHMGLLRLTEDTDTATIDDRLLFLFALANCKASRGHPDAGNYATMARNRIKRLTGLAHGVRRYIPRPSTGGLKIDDDCGPMRLPVGNWRP